MTDEWNETDDNWNLDGGSLLHVFKQGDSVVFTDSDATPGSVTLTNDIRVNDMTVNGGDYTFAPAAAQKLNGNTLTVDGGSAAMNLDATFSGLIAIGQTVGSDGTVTVDGANSKLTGGNELRVGDSGTGALNLTSGGKATASGAILLGNNSTGR